MTSFDWLVPFDRYIFSYIRTAFASMYSNIFFMFWKVQYIVIYGFTNKISKDVKIMNLMIEFFPLSYFLSF